MARKVASPPPRAGATVPSDDPPTNLDDVVGAIGPKLRELRQSHSLSLQQLAALSQVSAAAIHKVERGDMVPTITTLLKLSAALQRPVGFFIDELTEPLEVATHVPADRRTPIDTAVAGLTLHGVSGPPTRFRMRAEVITIAPGATSDDSPSRRGGEELLIVLEGELDVAVQGRDYRLGTGDTLHFPTDRARRWANPGRSTACALRVALSDR